ncbi:MAG: ATP-binding cassette domain-containing protein [Victivallaceae bacterium]|nr:ATP-binding cassette domain-containing protein [Victivallaceae bacterium]
MSTALLEVQGLCVDYPVRGAWFRKKRFLHAVSDVSFCLHAGETIGLVGESGCGKSTLGRALVGLVDVSRGSIRLQGVEIAGTKNLRARKKMCGKYQMIFQDPYGSLNPRLTIFESLDEVLRLAVAAPPRAVRREKAAALLTKVGLKADALDRYPHQFSGGQRQRIGIARSLAADPLFIVADEPVSALDVSVQASIVNLLDDIRRETQTSFLFIAHDLAVVEHISNRILVMYLGRVVESAGSRELIADARHPYTEALISAIPRVDQPEHQRIILQGDVPSPLSPPEGCTFHPRCPYATERCRRETPELKEISPGHCVRCFRAFGGQ